MPPRSWARLGNTRHDSADLPTGRLTIPCVFSIRPEGKVVENHPFPGKTILAGLDRAEAGAFPAAGTRNVQSGEKWHLRATFVAIHPLSGYPGARVRIVAAARS